jgi:hypothetical protein
MMTKMSLTKEIIKNYLLKFSALICRWVVFCGEPVTTTLQHQVVLQSLINHHVLVLKISVQGLSKGLGKTQALLNEPEGMFKADEDS